MTNTADTDEAWRPLTDAIEHARAGTPLSDDDIENVAKTATAWLSERGYTLAFMSRCWCQGKAEGNAHTPGCPGIEQDRLLNPPACSCYSIAGDDRMCDIHGG